MSKKNKLIKQYKKDNQSDTNICAHCFEKQGSYVANPYDEDINNIIKMEWICIDCYKQLCENI